MQFLNMKRSTKSTITFTFAELKKLVETEHSCVEKVAQRLHLTLLPFHLSNISSSISEILSSNVAKYNKDLNGILLGYKNIKILDSTPTIHNDNCLVHVTVDADFYLFKPCEGKALIGYVNQISDDHIGCLVHQAFNVVVPKEQNGGLVKKNQHILVKVSYTNLEAKLPYIKADLISIISDTDSGISTTEENYIDIPVSQNTPEIFIKKSKTSKKTKRGLYEEEPLINMAKSTLKKKKSHKQSCDQHSGEDHDVNYEEPSKEKIITDHDSSLRTLETYLDEYHQQNNLEVPSKKRKKKKKSKSFECEDSEEFHSSTLNEIGDCNSNENTDDFSNIKKAKKKKSKEHKEENQYIINEDTESMAFIPEVKQKKHKKKKFLNDEPDNYSSKSLEIDQKHLIWFDKEDNCETKPSSKKQENLKDKSPKFKILQNVILNPNQDLKLKECTLEKSRNKKHITIENDFEAVTLPKKKRKHKNIKENTFEDYNLDVIDDGDLNQGTVVDINEDDLSFVEKKNKHKKLKCNNEDKHLDISNESRFNLIQDLRYSAFESDTKDLNKVRKHKKSKKHNSNEIIDTTCGDIDKSEDNITFNLMGDLKRKALESTLESTINSKKNKKHKKPKQDSIIDQDLEEQKDNTLDLIEDLKRKALENALGASKDVHKTKKHKKYKQDSINQHLDKSNNATFDLIHDSYKNIVENMHEINTESKYKKSNDIENQNLIRSNYSTLDLIKDLKTKALEATLGEVNKKSEPKKLAESDTVLTEDLKRKAIENISKKFSSKEDIHIRMVNVDVDSKNKKAKKVKKYCKDMSSTKDLNLSEPEIDNIKHTALAQALSRITVSPEIKTHKKKKKKHKNELDINELKAQTLQKILGNLNEDEIRGHSKKKKKNKDKSDIDIDKMKQMAIDKLLDKNISKEENDSFGEESEQIQKEINKGKNALEKLTFEHRFGDEQSKHKVKKRKKEKD